MRIIRLSEIKITEISKFLTELKKTDKVGDDNLVDLLRYYQLINEKGGFIFFIFIVASTRVGSRSR